MSVEQVTGTEATRAQPAAMPRVAPRVSAKRRKALIGWLFMMPLIIVNLVVIIGPTIASVYYSFTDWSGIGPAEFVGLDNYRQMIQEGAFVEALKHNLIWTSIFLTVPIFMGLLGAFILSQIRRFQMLFRVLYFIPYMLASVVSTFVWQNTLDARTGIGPALAEIGIPWLEGVYFFGDQRLALPSVALASNWHWWGFVMLLFLAAMQSISYELYDAAKVDGANSWQLFRHVTLPSIVPVLIFVILISLIGSLLVFDYIFIMTQGGPAGASEVVATLMYKEAFAHYEAGYASAIALTMSFFTGIIIVVFLYLRRRGWEV